MATIGTILIQAANASGSITGPNAPSVVGMGGGGDASDDLRSQKKREEFEKKNLEQGEKAPKFWTAAFKKMGIQMGLAGILKQSQIFTSTVGSLFQIFGAFVDVILAPFVPMFIPAIRWLARQLPTVAKAAQWTADKIYKGVSGAWNWLTNGKMWSNVGNFFKDMSGAIWDKLEPVLGPIGKVFETLGEKMYEWILKPIKEGVKWLWNNSLGGKTLKTWKLSFAFPTWGGGSTGSLTDIPDGPKSKAEEAAEVGKNVASRLNPANWGGQHGDEFEGGTGSVSQKVKDGLIAAGLVIGGATVVNILTQSTKVGHFTKGKAARALVTGMDMTEEGDDVLRALKAKNLKLSRGGFWGALDDMELNPIRAFGGKATAGLHQITKPFAAIPKFAGKAVLGSGRLLAQSMGLMQGGVDDMAKAATTSGSGWGALGASDDLTTQARMPKGHSQADDLAQMKSKGPTKLSRAVNAFNQWVKKTGPKLKSAAGSGARAFQNVFDEGLSLADDVVKIAKVTPGMGVIGKIVSVGFKRVIPGIAGAYMVGETIADVWQIVKSDAPWLGDWKSLDAYKAEAMGAIFGGGKFGVNPVGAATNLLGFAQSKLGMGDSISDWQDQISKNQQEKGVLSSGKLMDAIIRGTTGIGGAALSTFFPGLGTIAGTALYEGGRYATTGVNVPGLGQLGGDVDKYGPAVDFSDRIIQAIEAGFSRGVPLVEIR